VRLGAGMCSWDDLGMFVIVPSILVAVLERRGGCSFSMPVT
jgi:hypothetical protein